MIVTICIGSSCHIKGSKQVVDRLKELIKQNGIEDKVELKGTFCMGNCQKGVSVKLGETIYSVNPNNVDEFFNENILSKIL